MLKPKYCTPSAPSTHLTSLTSAALTSISDLYDLVALILYIFLLTCVNSVTSFSAHLYDLRGPDVLEADGLDILEGEAEFLPVGQAGLELEAVQSHYARVSKK